MKGPVAAAGRRVFRLSFVSGLLLVLADSEATGTGECVHGLHIHWQVASGGSAAVESSTGTSESRTMPAGGVRGFEFTVVPVTVPGATSTTSK